MDHALVENFAEKVAADQTVAGAAVLSYLGDRLGLWATMAGAGPVTPDELAGISGLDARYLTEWLASQTVAGYVAHDETTGQFELPVEHAAVLADDDSPAAMSGGFEATAAFWAVSDRVADAFRTGDGIAWGDFDPRLQRGVARFFRPIYARSLVQEWLPAVDQAVPRLEAGAKVLDVGCGYGTSTGMLADAYPNSTFVGIEPDANSAAEARSAVQKAGVSDRVRIENDFAENLDLGDDWDFVFFFDAFHHIGDPVAVGRWARDRLAPDGALVLVEPLSRDHLADSHDGVHLTFFSASTLVCVPDALAQDGGVALGGQAGPTRLTGILHDAGFGQVRTALETDINLVVEARN
ncbi:MAG: methyltransferase domain-containing protein [Acidimicrobiales bacterium]|nr:methyltransferase domain-containing protein [Acidimicrobiales bacterium]